MVDGRLISRYLLSCGMFAAAPVGTTEEVTDEQVSNGLSTA